MSTAPYPPAETPAIARRRRGNRRKMCVDPGDERLHDEVFRRSGPLALGPLVFRTSRNPPGRHHGDERAHVATVDELVGGVREVQGDDERRRFAPEAMQEIQNRIALVGGVIRGKVELRAARVGRDEGVRNPYAPDRPTVRPLVDERGAWKRRRRGQKRPAGEDGDGRKHMQGEAQKPAPDLHPPRSTPTRLSAG